MLLVKRMLKIVEWIGHAFLGCFLFLLCVGQPEMALWSLLGCWLSYSIARFSMIRVHSGLLR